MNKITYNIKGMTCSSCAASINKETNSIKGVNTAVVNFANSKIAISYNENVVTEETIIKKIAKLGYKLSKDKSEEESNKKIITTLILGAVAFYIGMSHMTMLPLPNIIDYHNNPLNFAIVQFFITLLIMILGKNFFTKGVKALIYKNPNMDSLVAIGTGSAFIYSIFATYMIYIGNHNYSENLFYETAAVIITLVMLGKYLEDKNKKKTNSAIEKLFELQPDTAIILKKGIEVVVKLEEVSKNDICIVKPGSKIPVDGVITKGDAVINEAHITGESSPVKKHIDDNVVVGSILLKGNIQVKTANNMENNTISKIIKLVEEANMKKAPISKMADKISYYFVPTVIIFAITMAIIWAITGHSAELVFTIFISILVIACPCALGLATPVSIMAGTGIGALDGILFKSGESLELLAKVDKVIFDKTGTLTVGKPIVTDFITFEHNEKDALSFIASAENKSEHPLSIALIDYASKNKIDLFGVDHFENIDGLGISAKKDGQTIHIGSAKLMKKFNVNITKYNDNLSCDGKTVIYAAIDNQLVAVIGVTDKIKDESYELIQNLKKLKLKIYMLTGDNKQTANKIGDKLGIENVIAEVMPEDKSNHVKKLMKTSKVAMIGDGVNDAIALSQADVGIAIGSGTDIAIDSADVILMNKDLNKITKAIKISKETIKTIKQNLFWAFIYNVIGIPIAAGLLYIMGGPLLNPMFAGAAMAFSSLSVVLNALRLKKKRL